MPQAKILRSAEMWVCVINGQRRYLRPGRTYEVGRSRSKGTSSIVLKEPSVSRVHLQIVVDAVLPFSSAHISQRYRVRVRDLKSRFGTCIDGERLPPDKLVELPCLNRVELQVGQVQSLFFEWHPLIVTLSIGESPSTREGLWREVVEKLEPLGVKVVPDVVRETSVFMKTGKSSSKLAYALVKNLPIVNTHYAAALAAAASDMELDLANTPDASTFVADKGYGPNERRGTCLRGITVEVLQEDQYQAFEPVVSAAGGRCCLVSGSVKKKPNTYVLKPSAELRKSVACREYLDPVAFLAIIRDARQPTAGDLISGKAAARHERPQQVNMLAFMAAEPDEALQPGVNVEPIHPVQPVQPAAADSGSTSRESCTMADFSPQQGVAQPQRLVRQVNMLDFVESAPKRFESQSNSPVVSQCETLPGRAPTARTAQKRRRSALLADENFDNFSASADEGADDVASDKAALCTECPCVVEASLPIGRPPSRTAPAPAPVATTANFKAFRKQRVWRTGARVPLGDEVDPPPEAAGDWLDLDGPRNRATYSRTVATSVDAEDDEFGFRFTKNR